MAAGPCRSVLADTGHHNNKHHNNDKYNHHNHHNDDAARHNDHTRSVDNNGHQSARINNNELSGTNNHRSGDYDNMDYDDCIDPDCDCHNDHGCCDNDNPAPGNATD